MSDQRNTERREQIKESLAEDLWREPTPTEIQENFMSLSMDGIRSKDVCPRDNCVLDSNPNCCDLDWGELIE